VRTTVTLDPDTLTLVQEQMQRRGVSFKVALNDAIRAGLGRSGASAGSFTTRSADLGVATVNLDKALQLAGELEDEELIRRMRVGE
jgi:hypothetical protein